MASNTAKKRLLQTESNDDTEQNPHFVFKGNDSFARFLVIKPEEEKAFSFRYREANGKYHWDSQVG